MAGTFGVVVEAGGARQIPSKNHVLANENRLPIGTPIFQPGLLGGGDVAADRIAELARFIAIDRDGLTVVDCAIAEVLDAETVCPTFLPRVERLESAVSIRRPPGWRRISLVVRPATPGASWWTTAPTSSLLTRWDR